MSLFLTIKKLGFQTDPLPPLSLMSLYILFFFDGFPKWIYFETILYAQF